MNLEVSIPITYWQLEAVGLKFRVQGAFGVDLSHWWHIARFYGTVRVLVKEHQSRMFSLRFVSGCLLSISCCRHRQKGSPF